MMKWLKAFFCWVWGWVCGWVSRAGARAAVELPPPPDNWRGAAAAVVGDKHLRASPPVPCQDAALVCFEEGRRPCAFVADGAGSAELSHFGAGWGVLSLPRLCLEVEADNVRLLDGDEAPAVAEVEAHVRKFVADASETIALLAARSGQPFRKFHCTLLGTVAGRRRILWFHVGDGYVVMETNGRELRVVGAEEKTGFANVTTFVKEDAAAIQFRYGVVSAEEATGMALMTDGAAEKLVRAGDGKVAGAVNKFLAGVRGGEFLSGELHNFLSDANIWKPGRGYTGDDKGVALLARVD